MTRTKFNQRQEVLALSIANVMSGVFGGIPATAALARTALNIKTGATSRMAGIISCMSMQPHSFQENSFQTYHDVAFSGVLFLSLVVLPYFKYLPLPNIAAMLCVVAFRMIEFEEIGYIWRNKVAHPTLWRK